METLPKLWQWCLKFIDFFVHLDVHLNSVILEYGTWTYLILFLIIFCETGLVVTPILPGDSLLFAAGAFCATGALELWPLIGLLFIAAVLGDAANYAVGNYFGSKLMNAYPRVFRPEYLEKTRKFYERYGGKTIIYARFVPIVRTFAPFLAGVGKMSYPRFAAYNVIGALLWVGLFVIGGNYFGNIPMVKKNFTLVILAVIALSVMPAVIEAWRARKEAAAG